LRKKIAESDLVFAFERGLLPIGLAQYVPDSAEAFLSLPE